MIQVIVLLGPPGSGKSTIGRELGRRGYRWREWEVDIVGRWGSHDAFVAAKAEALPALHEEVRRWIADGDPPAVFETTGLSDAAFLDELDRDLDCFVVRLDITEDEALRRVSSRTQGRHLTDDADGNRHLWDAYEATVLPHRRVDLVVDTATTTPADAARAIAAASRRPD